MRVDDVVTDDTRPRARRDRGVARRPARHRGRTGHRRRRAVFDRRAAPWARSRSSRGGTPPARSTATGAAVRSTATTGSSVPAERRRDSDQRRRHVRVRLDSGRRASAPRSAATPASAYRRLDQRGVAREFAARLDGAHAAGAGARVRRPPWLHQARSRPRLGAGGRRRLLQGSADRARHHRRPARRRTAGARGDAPARPPRSTSTRRRAWICRAACSRSPTSVASFECGRRRGCRRCTASSAARCRAR